MKQRFDCPIECHKQVPTPTSKTLRDGTRISWLTLVAINVTSAQRRTRLSVSENWIHCGPGQPQRSVTTNEEVPTDEKISFVVCVPVIVLKLDLEFVFVTVQLLEGIACEYLSSIGKFFEKLRIYL